MASPAERVLLRSTLTVAERLLREGRHEEAKSLYRRVCVAKVPSPEAWAGLSAAEYHLGSIDAALSCADIALSLDHRSVRAQVLRIACLVDLSRLVEAVTAAERLLAAEPENVPALLNKATALVRLARFQEALTASDRVLAVDSNHPTGHLNRGLALQGLRRFGEALSAFERALELRPDYGTARVNLCSVLIGLGRYGDALQAVDQALASDPDNLAVLVNRGAALLHLGHSEEAVDALRKAIERAPTHLNALCNLAAACTQLGRFDEALTAADRALAAKPDLDAAWRSRGNALFGLGRLREALEAYDHLLSVVPADPQLLVLSSEVLFGLERYEEALARALKSLELSPGNPEAVLAATGPLIWLDRPQDALQLIGSALDTHPSDVALWVARSSVLLALKHYAQALDASDRALQLAPHFPDALNNRGAALNALGRFAEAVDVYDHLIQQGSRRWQIYSNRAQSLAGMRRFAEAEHAFTEAQALGPREFAAYQHRDRTRPIPRDAALPPIDAEAEYLSFLLDRVDRCDWGAYDQSVSEVVELTERRLVSGRLSPVHPFRLLALPVSPDLQYRVAANRAAWINEAMAGFQVEGEPVGRDPARGVLRIGYVSADFRNHPTAHLMRTVFGVHDRREVQVYAYSLRGGPPDSYRERIARESDEFVDLSAASNAEAARRIRRDGIDILVDLMGHTRHSRPEIFALRPAPVQVAYLGFPGTTGASFIDYVIADETVLPADLAAHFSEVPVYLPDSYQVNDRSQEVAHAGRSRSDEGLPQEGFVFCCFNGAFKIEPRMFGVWMNILKRVPGGVLWLLPRNPEVRANLRREAEARGIAPQRLVFSGKVPKAEHLERHRLADLFLDTLYCNAHTTASDALWAGVPVLTCPGETFASRVAASLLRAVGMSKLIVEDLSQYEDTAVCLARRPEELEALRNEIWSARLTHPLFDTESTVRVLERAYRLMWERVGSMDKASPLRVAAPSTGGSRNYP
jgi:protein O-GlcNAc transferase